MLKVFHKTCCTILLVVALLSSCKETKKENLLADKILSINLNISNEYIYRSTNVMIETFRKYSDNAAVSQKTNPMLENMELVKKITAETIEYLDDLKRELKIEAGLTLVDMKETYNEDDFNVVVRFFKSEKKGIEVLNQLIKYQNSIQQVNPELFNSLKSPYYFFDYLSTSKEKLESNFTNMYFGNINTVSSIAVLSKLENDVRIYENKAVTFFFTKVAIDMTDMEK